MWQIRTSLNSQLTKPSIVTIYCCIMFVMVWLFLLDEIDILQSGVSTCMLWHASGVLLCYCVVVLVCCVDVVVYRRCLCAFDLICCMVLCYIPSPTSLCSRELSDSASAWCWLRGASIVWCRVSFVVLFVLVCTCVCVLCIESCLQARPYHVDSTASRPLSEVKHARARLVLRWGANRAQAAANDREQPAHSSIKRNEATRHKSVETATTHHEAVTTTHHKARIVYI